MRFLVTAGSTREGIDSVRGWGHMFTGNTGLAIARALAAIGPVDLLTSNTSHLTELASHQPSSNPIVPSPYASHAELKGSIAALLARRTYEAVFMTAAVSDYRPLRTYSVLNRCDQSDGTEQWTVRDVQAPKVRGNHPSIAILGEPTQKLVDLFRTDWNHRGMLVKFKLEVGVDNDALLKIGDQSRRASGAEYLVANTLDMLTGPDAGAFLVSENSHQWVPRAALPETMAALVLHQ